MSLRVFEKQFPPRNFIAYAFLRHTAKAAQRRTYCDTLARGGHIELTASASARDDETGPGPVAVEMKRAAR